MLPGEVFHDLRRSEVDQTTHVETGLLMRFRLPLRMTPYISSDVYASVIQQLVLDTLATRDPETLEWLPLVASEWTASRMA